MHSCLIVQSFRKKQHSNLEALILILFSYLSNLKYFHYSVNAKKTSLASNKMVAKLVYILIFTLFLQCEKIYMLSNCGLKVIALKGEKHLMT